MEINPENKLPTKPGIAWKILRRVFLWVFFLPLALVLGLISLVFIYEDEVKKAILNELNKKLNTEVRVNPSDIDFTVLQTFPNAGLQFKNVMAYDSYEGELRDTLFTSKLLSLEFNLSDIWNKNYNIRRIYAEALNLNLKIDKSGNTNYNFWKKDTLNESDGKVNFKMEDVEIKQSFLNFKNRKNKTKFIGKINALQLKGIFYQDDYNLDIHASVFVNEFKQNQRIWLNDKLTLLNLSLEVRGTAYHLKEAEVSFNKVKLDAKGKITKDKQSWYAQLTFNAKNLDFASTLSLLPEEYQKSIFDYTSEGLFYAGGSFTGPFDNFQNAEFDLKFGVEDGKVTYNPNNIHLSNLQIKGQYSKSKNTTERFQINNFSGLLEEDAVQGNVLIENFSDPFIEMGISGKLNLSNLIKFYPIDTLEKLKGVVQIEAEVKGKLKSIREDFSSTANISKGSVNIHDLEFKFKRNERDIKIASGKLILEQVNVKADSLSLSYGNNLLMIQGELNNFMAWLLKDKEVLTIQGKLISNEFFAEDFLLSNDNSGEFNLNPELRVSLDLELKKLHWKRFTGTHVVGNVKIMDNKIWADNISFETMNGDVAFTGLLDARDPKYILIGGNAKLVGIDVHQLFYQTNNFGQNVLQDKHLKGTATASVDFKALWDRKLKCDLNSIQSTAEIRIEKGELIGFQPLEKLSKHISLEELKHIRFSNFQSHVEIKNQLINISRTEIANSALNLEFYGTHTFSNQIDYHIKMLLSEVLSNRPGKSKELDQELEMVENDPDNKRCVFLKMKGPLDNPEIKYDQKAMKQKIKEDIVKEKHNIKQILKEEFGWFKKDSTLNETNKTSNTKDQKFQIDFEGNKKKGKIEKPIEKTDDDDDF